MFWHGHAMGVWGMWYLTIGAAVLVALAIAIAVALSRPDRRSAGPTPQQVLADRFARGEIDEDEYRSRLEVLTGGRRPG